MERISVIIPVYNDQQHLTAALSSLQAQKEVELEVIIVDDGSRMLVEVPQSAQSLDIRIIRQENQGAPAARNRGLSVASGEYCIFWDVDVTATHDDVLSLLVERLKNQPEASFAYGNMIFGFKRMPARNFSIEELHKKNYIHTTALIRTSDAVSWDTALKRFQDWDYYLTLAEQGKRGVWIDQDLFHIEPGGTMSSWLPSFAYKKPWSWLPGIHSRVRAYHEAADVIKKKHKLI